MKAYGGSGCLVGGECRWQYFQLYSSIKKFGVDFYLNAVFLLRIRCWSGIRKIERNGIYFVVLVFL
jgi:hypothetical protein